MNKERRTSFARQSPFQAGQFRQKTATPGAEVRRSWRADGDLRELGLE
jgi:hypothetical protein